MGSRGLGSGPPERPAPAGTGSSVRATRPETLDGIVANPWYGDFGAPTEGFLGSGETLDATPPRADGVDDFMRAISMSIKGMLLFLSGDLETGIRFVEDARRIQECLNECEGSGLALTSLTPGSCTTNLRWPVRSSATGRRLHAYTAKRDGPRSPMGTCPKRSAASVGPCKRTRKWEAHAGGTDFALLALAAVETAEDRSERAVGIAVTAQASPNAAASAFI